MYKTLKGSKFNSPGPVTQERTPGFIDNGKDLSVKESKSGLNLLSDGMFWNHFAQDRD